MGNSNNKNSELENDQKRSPLKISLNLEKEENLRGRTFKMKL